MQVTFFIVLKVDICNVNFSGALPLSVHFGQSLFPPFNDRENDGDDFEKL